MSVIIEFNESLQNSHGVIRNPAGYIMGVSKRLIEQNGARVREQSIHEPIMGKHITQRVIDRLRQLEQGGFCTMDELNRECLSLMEEMSEAEALAAIDELRASDRTRIKSLSPFFSSILRKYQRKDSVLGKRVLEGSKSLQLFPDIAPAPDAMPLDLYYFDPFNEYAPCMPQVC